MRTTAEAAADLQVSRRRVNELIKLGTLKATRFGNAWQVDSESVEAYKNSPRKAGHPKQRTNAAHTRHTAPVGAEGTTMSNTIEIAIDTTDDAMVGGNGWNGARPRESVLQFLANVRAEVVRYWPGYQVTIEETEHANTVYLYSDSIEGPAVEEEQAAIREAISDVWQRGDWYVE